MEDEGVVLEVRGGHHGHFRADDLSEPVHKRRRLCIALAKAVDGDAEGLAGLAEFVNRAVGRDFHRGVHQQVVVRDSEGPLAGREGKTTDELP